MGIATAGKASLIKICNKQFPVAGAIGAVTLLTGDLILNLPCIADPLSGEITAASHGFITGSRIRFAGTLPTPLISGQDYVVILISANVFNIAETVSEALLGNAIGFTDAGASVVANEQQLQAGDELLVLLRKELIHPALPARIILSAVGAATGTDVPLQASKSLAILVANTHTTAAVFRHVMILMGTAVSSIIGSDAGVQEYYLSDEGGTVAILPGGTKSIALTLRAKVA